jgi:hypothetical protein
MDNEGFYRVFEIAVVVLEIFTIGFYQSRCSRFNARSRRQRICAYAAFGIVLACFSLFYSDMAVLSIVTFAGILCTFALFFKGRLTTHVSMSILYLAIGIGIEVLVAFAESFLAGIDLGQLHGYGTERVIGAATAKLINLPVAVLFASAIGMRNEPFAGRMLKTMPLLICQFILTLILASGFIADYRNDDRTVFYLVETVGIIFISVIVFLYYDMTVSFYEYRHRQELSELRSRDDMKYYRTVKSNLETLLALDHDINRHTAVLERLIEDGKHTEALRYIASFGASVKTALAGRTGFVNTNDPVIGAILYDRLQRAEELGVRADLNIRIPDSVAVDGTDLTVIIGNTFDNALEALALLPSDSARTLSINLSQFDCYFFYEISNSFDKGTKKKTGRGYGLRNVEAAVDKYGGQFSAGPKNGLFCVTVSINIPSRNQNH